VAHRPCNEDCRTVQRHSPVPIAERCPGVVLVGGRESRGGGQKLAVAAACRCGGVEAELGSPLRGGGQT
jgi:hypothetical protein